MTKTAVRAYGFWIGLIVSLAAWGQTIYMLIDHPVQGPQSALEWLSLIVALFTIVVMIGTGFPRLVRWYDNLPE